MADSQGRVEPQSTRRRGRPKKSDSLTPELLDETSTPPPTRRRHRASKKNDEDRDNAAYHPTESDQVEEGEEDADVDTEVGALAWGLITAGGLGYGSAAVFGAELMAR